MSPSLTRRTSLEVRSSTMDLSSNLVIREMTSSLRRMMKQRSSGFGRSCNCGRQKSHLVCTDLRDHQSLGKGSSTSTIRLIRRVAEALGDEYVFLIRTHVLVTKKPKIPAQHREQFIDVTAYPDIQELYLITDLLITDYSSVFFDFANMNRLMMFYAYDLTSIGTRYADSISITTTIFRDPS